MIHSYYVQDYKSWRDIARRLLAAGLHPAQVMWNDDNPQDTLFPQTELPPPTKALNINRSFITLAEIVACHRHPERWNLLYNALWRLTHGEPYLLKISSDPLTHALNQMHHAVKRDAHKTKAFVRFRLTQDEDGSEHYVAWHRPDHFILPIVAGFFSRRFNTMRWTILTPDQSLEWDGQTLHYGPGVPAATVQDDALEDLWRGYYRAIFNPARIKIKMMKSEMPVRHWATLPEATVIQEILREAPERVQQMITLAEGSAISAKDFLPQERDIEHLRIAANACEGCDLYQCATQTVFGEGPSNAKLMLVGEQPGNEEDLQGRPFVGPAGKVLDQALQETGIKREELYVTNAVKHFKYQLKEGFRHHRTPSLREITGCKPWLEAEIIALKPTHILCLGNIAARSLISNGFTLKSGRGRWMEQHGAQLRATYHPSAILRAPNETQQQALYHALVEDLYEAKKAVS